MPISWEIASRIILRIDSPLSAEDKVLMAPNQTANGLV
jgi:hypothetical protein